MKNVKLKISAIFLLSLCGCVVETAMEGIIETGNITNITSNSAICEGNFKITFKGDVKDILYEDYKEQSYSYSYKAKHYIPAMGFVIGTTPNLTSLTHQSISKKSEGAYVLEISGLTSNTKYYVCAFVTINATTYYGNIKEFMTL